MRIAFVTQPWDDITPGLESGSSIPLVTSQLARRLTTLGHQCILYGPGKNAGVETETDAQDITYCRIPTTSDRARVKLIGAAERLLSFPFNRTPFFSSHYYHRDYVRQIGRSLADCRPDIVHIHNFSQYAPILRRALPSARIVLHMHCAWLTQLDRRMIERRLLDVDRVLSCSDYISSSITAAFPHFAAGTHTLLNGVNTEMFSPLPASPRNPDDGKRLLFVARISPEKGVHVLLDAFKLVLRKHPDCQLELIGGAGGDATYEFVVLMDRDDPLMREMKKYYTPVTKRVKYSAALEASLDGTSRARVHFAGAMSNRRLVEEYRRADVFVFPSLWNEPFGMPPVEAMACGIPVVATRGGGLTEIVAEGETGYLVERGNPGELAAAITTLLDNPPLRARMGAAGHARALQKFSWDTIVDQLNSWYQELTHA